MAAWHKRQIVLVGFSFGADALPAIVPRLPPDLRHHIRLVGLVGLSATVITPIPQQGVGEIAYVQGGARYTAPARSESGAAIGSGQTVKIHRIVGTQFYVVPQ